MNSFVKEIKSINIEEELKNSYLDYAMSVIVGRALPDVRDGLKPVHRRILYAMYILRNTWDKPYKKSARIVGDVIGKYHPHGDNAVYDTIVRLAQSFSLRYTLIKGQGNFGSIDGDSAAAMRYTEIKMTKIAQEIINDLEKNTVNFLPNYDGTEKIPEIMPTKIPNLLINGSSGIAVGMTTNIPPHNITEVINACLAYIKNNTITIKELMNYIPGPDFPTAGIICGISGIENAYETGKGKIFIRGRNKIIKNKKSNYKTIIIYELPYQVNKAKLIAKIANLIKEKKIKGIKTLRDESDKDGIRIIIKIKKDVSTNVILNNLYSLTSLQISFSIKMVSLYKGEPTVMSLKNIIKAFISHRREIVTKRTFYEIKKARNKAHILEGLIVALLNIEKIIKIIRSSKILENVKNEIYLQSWKIPNKLKIFNLEKKEILNIYLTNSNLIKFNNNYRFSYTQIKSILELKLNKLTNLEHKKLCIEYQYLINKISKLIKIIENYKNLMEVIYNELILIKKEFGDKRKTKIILDNNSIIKTKDLINDEKVIITLSYQGYIKYQKITEYNIQHRGGKGKLAIKLKENDVISKILVAYTRDNILCFSNKGRLYWLKVYNIPEASRYSKGRPIINIIPLKNNEIITNFLIVNNYTENMNLFMVTLQGNVKKTNLTKFSNPRRNGIIAIKLRKNDSLVGVSLISKHNKIMLFTNLGKVVKFDESQVRTMGRNTMGVKGIKISNKKKDSVVSLIVIQSKFENNIFTITENGYGKCTNNKKFPVKSRATKGIISMKINSKNGKMIGSLQVINKDQIILITNMGTLIRINISEICIIGRNTKGVIVINTKSNEKVVGLQKI
ncbi:DNA topoisomerase (ATP-hydrolyzing) subunit A [Enterobacteriaceae endosymbiont of Donacia versicolorea]|uniref:DNA topoisomerase (ATP-hydrolyzing) subunit A n=1 Tax=Enterobacteriaceae endosymbiont of Donacia versicolorea TaxID=2675788 RepID=UPI001448E211|nr:DNA topoisomerase (ATP-hydrolyzing) subunit A [Enterobacteriaceae endosymbiont of Donacia versicolorea]QJC32005.1 DNA topoisomerase (ATP-hydrolyzing) subunit A [Enterobacteriaceae endosymbiont of Donacia versicolorea]